MPCLSWAPFALNSGLFDTRNLVTQVLGGTIVCKGNPGEGVEVTISLPMKFG